METAITPFRKYIRDLARGKFDSYLDSTRWEDKYEGWGLIRDPFLLLHDLGKYPDWQRINRLFINGTVSVELNSCDGSEF